MTDKELLEWAAKAAGMPDMSKWTWQDIDTYGWNPLTDDGDALRLVVKLKIEVLIGNKHAYAEGVSAESSVSEVFTDDPYAATRRAIVRAAAEIGKGMK